MISAKDGLLDANALGTDSHSSRRRSSATGGVRRAAPAQLNRPERVLVMGADQVQNDK